MLARGDDSPDALAASIHGGVNSAPLLLSATPNNLSDATVAWLRATCPDIDTIRAIGGRSAIAAETLARAVASAQWCVEPEGVIGPTSTEDRESDPFPGEDGTAQLVEVRAAEHDGFDRVVFEVVLTGDFEANLEWAIGLETEAPYAVGVLDDPVRVVVDVLHE